MQKYRRLALEAIDSIFSLDRSLEIDIISGISCSLIVVGVKVKLMIAVFAFVSDEKLEAVSFVIFSPSLISTKFWMNLLA